MEANENLTAKEAREISEKNQLSVEKAMGVIFTKHFLFL